MRYFNIHIIMHYGHVTCHIVHLCSMHYYAMCYINPSKEANYHMMHYTPLLVVIILG